MHTVRSCYGIRRGGIGSGGCSSWSMERGRGGGGRGEKGVRCVQFDKRRDRDEDIGPELEEGDERTVVRNSRIRVEGKEAR